MTVFGRRPGLAIKETAASAPLSRGTASSGTTDAEARERLAPDDPMAGFSHNQWYCHQARQTVFYGVFMREAPTEDALVELAHNLIVSAPQLATGFEGAVPGQLPSRTTLEALVEVREVDDLEPFPRGFDLSGPDLFDRRDLPLFRMIGLRRKSGADAQGRAGALLVLSTHALMEGSDSVLLSRSRTAAHDAPTLPPERSALWRRAWYRAAAAVMAPAQLALAHVIAPRTVDRVYEPVSVSRERLRRIAQSLGVRQRSIMFAAAAFVLNNGGEGFSRRRLSVIYADLNQKAVRATGEDFFRYRMVETKFAVREAFADFAREVDRTVSRAERKDATGTQHLLNALFAAHRKMKKWMPGIYSDRIFRFTGTYHLDLSVVPPLRLSGPLTVQFMAPVYLGTFHPGLNVCVFAPGREHVTFNFTVKSRLAGGIAALEPLLAALDPAS